MDELQLKRIFLQQRQKLPLTIKIEMTKRRIRAWYEQMNGKIYVSFSGGADSTVLLHIVRSIYPETPAVFVDTGMEFPETRDFVKQTPNVIWVRPKMSFKQVCETYGFPVVSKETAQKIEEYRNTKSSVLKDLRAGNVIGRKRHGIPNKWKYLIDAPFKISAKCCDILKKQPLKMFSKDSNLYPITGIMASESAARTQLIAKRGCFSTGTIPRCDPMSFWTSEDTHKCLQFLPHSLVYDMGYNRTGCIFCAFGAHMEVPNKFQRLRETHPKLHKLAIPALGIDKVLDYCGIPY